MSAGISIVPIAEEHIGGFHALLDEVARERRWHAMQEAPRLEDLRKYVGDKIAAGTPHFIALAGTQPVGWCDVYTRPQASWRHNAVLGMGVLRSYRGRGIGAELLNALLHRAKEQGLTRIELTVRVDNANAKKLYEKAGFVVE